MSNVPNTWQRASLASLLSLAPSSSLPSLPVRFPRPSFPPGTCAEVVRCGAVRCGAVRCASVRCGAVRREAARFDTRFRARRWAAQVAPEAASMVNFRLLGHRPVGKLLLALQSTDAVVIEK